MCGPEITSNRNPSALQYTYAPRLAPERSTFSLNLCSGLVAGFVSTKTWPGDTDLPVPLPPMTTAQPLSELENGLHRACVRTVVARAVVELRDAERWFGPLLAVVAHGHADQPP